MRRRETGWRAAVAVVACSLAPLAGRGVDAADESVASKAGSIQQLAWLAGCWVIEGKDRVVEERWMEPAGGTMLGVSRTVAGGKTVAFEFLRIEERPAGLTYVALPSGQRQAEFTQVELGAGTILFANPAHDFPQRIRYRLDKDGALRAQVEGEIDGRTRVEEFPYRRTSCETKAP
jgi:hypothetical protein